MRNQLFALKQITNNIENKEQTRLAIKNLETILEDEKNILHNYKGIIYFSNDQFEEAIKEFQLALSYDSQNLDIMLNLGLSYKLFGNFNEALKYFVRCNEIVNNNKQIQILIADTQREMQNFNEAEQLLNKLYSQYKMDDEIIELLIELQLDQKKIEQANQQLEILMKCEINDIQLLLTLSQRFQDQKLYDQAIKILDKILQKDNNNLDAYYNKGIIYFNIDDSIKALKCFEIVVQQDSNNISALTFLSLSFAQLNRINESLKIYEQILKINPKNATVWNNKGTSFREMKQYDKAIYCFDQAIQINQNNPLYKVNKATVLLEINKQEGLKLLSQAQNEFNQLINNEMFTSYNIKYMKEQFEKIESLTNEQDINKIQKYKEQQSEQIQQKQIIDQEEDKKKDYSILQQSCMIYQTDEMSQITNSIIGSNFNNKKINKKLHQKQTQIYEIVKQLKLQIIDIETRLEKAGINQRVEIHNQLTLFQQSQVGKNQLAYYKAFYWTVFNYFNTYNNQSTGLFLVDNSKTVETNAEQIVNVTDKIVNIGVKLTSSIPALNLVISTIHSALSTLFTLYKDNKHQDRIDIICQIIQNKSFDQNDLELQIGQASLDLAIQKNEILSKLDEPQQNQENKSFLQEIRKIANRMLDSKNSLYQGKAAQIGLEDALHCLGYFYQNGLVDEQEKLSEQLVNIIILKRYINNLQQTEIVDKSNCSSCCSIF